MTRPKLAFVWLMTLAVGAAAQEIGVVNVDELVLRPCASPKQSECPEITRLPEGSRVKILGAAAREGWVRVDAVANGKELTGFVNGKYLDRVARSSPAAPQASTPAAPQPVQPAPAAASQTLEDQEKMAEYLLQEINIATTNGHRILPSEKALKLKAYCVDNPFAAALRCPREFITRPFPSAAAPLFAPPAPVGDEPLIVMQKRARIKQIVAEINQKLYEIQQAMIAIDIVNAPTPERYKFGNKSFNEMFLPR